MVDLTTSSLLLYSDMICDACKGNKRNGIQCTLCNHLDWKHMLVYICKGMQAEDAAELVITERAQNLDNAKYSERFKLHEAKQ